MSRKAIIVGGGIGGLAAATALRRNGLEVSVYERAQTAAQIQVGGGIHVWHNGMRALAQLGLAEGVEAAGALVEHADFRTWRGDLLARWEVGPFGRRIGAPTVGVSRADLHPVLLDAQPEGTMQFGRVFASFSSDADGVTVRFADGSEERADVLIGADGIGSAVRAQLHGTDEKPRYSGYSVWQAIVDYDMEHERVPLGDFELYWGPGSRFAYYHVGGERMYWFGLTNAPPRGTDPPGLRDVILDRFSGWPDPIASMIEATDEAAITRNDICDRRPSRRWGQGRVTLLGDAAHAMTFNVSQGACQSLEDAVVLMRCLDSTGDVEAALRSYEKRRYDRTAPIQRRAYRIGAVGRWENRAACRFRDSVMGFAFPRFVVKGHEREMVARAMTTDYDVIVVGGGLGGISAAALLAKNGRKVLVVEQGEAAGGYAHAFTRGPYTFDPAVHFTVQAAEGAILDMLLRVLEVRDDVMFQPVESLWASRFPGFELVAPVGKEAFIKAHAERFPHEADGIRAFVELAEQVTEESQKVGASVSWKDLDAAFAAYPTLFRWRKATVADVLDEHIEDPHVKAVLSASWPYAGLPPSRLAFLTWAATTMSTLEDGPFHVHGSFQRLVDAFVTALERHGGELLLRRRVERIDIRDGRATGVTLDGGVQLSAPVVIANADARQVLERMVGLEHFPNGYGRRLKRLEPALSACVAFTATSLDLRGVVNAHETFLNRSWDHDDAYRDILTGELGGLWMTVPTLLDPTLAPPGEHTVILTSPMAYDVGEPWSARKERLGELMLDRLEEAIPGFRDHLRFFELATPMTLERFAGNHQGAMYGWANTPSQATSQRLARRTPIGGLYLSGHWTQPGCGSLRAIFSGTQTAQEVLGYANLDDFLDAEFISMFVIADLLGVPA